MIFVADLFWDQLAEKNLSLDLMLFLVTVGRADLCFAT